MIKAVIKYSVTRTVTMNCFSYAPKEGDVEKEEEAAE